MNTTSRPTAPSPTVAANAAPTSSTAPASASAEPKPRLPGWARALLAMALFLPCAMAAALTNFIPGAGAIMSGSNNWAALGLFSVSGLFALAAYLLASGALTRFIDRRPLSRLGLRLDRRALVGFLLAVTAAIAVGLVVGLIAQATGLGRDLTGAQEAAGGAAVEELSTVPIAVQILWVLMLAFVMQGIGEEVLFRGYVLQTLSSRPVIAVLVSAVTFTIPHLTSNGGQQSTLEHVLYLAIPFGFSFSAAAFGIAMRSVWAAVGIHGGFHVGTGVTLILGLPTDGPALWALLGLGHVVMAAVVMALIPRRRWAEMAEHGPYARPVRAAA